MAYFAKVKNLIFCKLKTEILQNPKLVNFLKSPSLLCILQNSEVCYYEKKKNNNRLILQKWKIWYFANSKLQLAKSKILHFFKNSNFEGFANIITLYFAKVWSLLLCKKVGLFYKSEKFDILEIQNCNFEKFETRKFSKVKVFFAKVRSLVLCKKVKIVGVECSREGKRFRYRRSRNF